MTIKHLVLSGGGPTLISTLGNLQFLEKSNYFSRENINSIYGTSAGAIVGVMYCLKFEWNDLNDYIIKRPWKDVFPLKVENIFDSFSKKGIFDNKTIEKCFIPLLKAKDLEVDITLKDFFDYSKIEIHFFTFEINKFTMVDISYLSHPDLKLLLAIQMSCALPVLVTPVCIENECFIDGGVVCNYPLQYCLDKFKIEEEILGFRNQYDEEERNNNTKINKDSNLLDFIMNFLLKLISNLSSNDKQPKIPFEVITDTKYMTIEFLKKSFSSEETRRDLFNDGVKSAEKFFLLQKL
jgi:predicted acylesterase/phospholipase RssA